MIRLYLISLVAKSLPPPLTAKVEDIGMKDKKINPAQHFPTFFADADNVELEKKSLDFILSLFDNDLLKLA